MSRQTGLARHRVEMNAYAYVRELRYEIANPFDVRKIGVDAHTGDKISFPDRIYDSLSSAWPKTKSIGVDNQFPRDIHAVSDARYP